MVFIALSQASVAASPFRLRVGRSQWPGNQPVGRLPNVLSKRDQRDRAANAAPLKRRVWSCWQTNTVVGPGDPDPATGRRPVSQRDLLNVRDRYGGNKPACSAYSSRTGEFSVEENRQPGVAIHSSEGWLPSSVSSPLRIVTLIPVSRVKPHQAAFGSQAPMLRIGSHRYFAALLARDIVAVNAAQNNNNADIRMQTLQLIEFTLGPVPKLSATRAKRLSHPPKWMKDSEGRRRHKIRRRGWNGAYAACWTARPPQRPAPDCPMNRSGERTALGPTGRW